VATKGTIESGAYRAAILAQAPGATVVERSASWLVPLIEAGPDARSSVGMRLQPLIEDICSEGVDTLILGCTHFPLISDVFQRHMSDGVTMLDSAETTALELATLLETSALCSNGQAVQSFLVTGPASAFEERARAMFGASPNIEAVSLGVAHAT